MATAPLDSGRTPLMLVHGAWLSARSWENFADYFEKRGFAVSTPEWPRKHGDVEELRADAEELKGLGLTEIVDHHAELIRKLDQPPVLIGHSFGGLIVELLLDAVSAAPACRSARPRRRASPCCRSRRSKLLLPRSRIRRNGTES